MPCVLSYLNICNIILSILLFPISALSLFFYSPAGVDFKGNFTASNFSKIKHNLCL